MSRSKPNRWAEVIRDGGAGTFFKAHLDDHELAAKINELFSDSVPVSAGQIQRDRQRFHNRPQRGEQITEEEASPTKNVIRNKASQLVVREALVEILDNIFDNFERHARDDLRVDVVVYPKTQAAPGEIVITENSGGIEKKRIVPLIMLGFPERSARGIGAWGEGFKMAAFALGDEVEVFSTYPGEDSVSIHFPRGWLDPNHPLWTKWKVNTYSVPENPPPEGTTIIRVNHLHGQVLEWFGLGKDQDADAPQTVCKELAKYFGEIYAEKYHSLVSQGYDISIAIAIGAQSEEVEFADRVKGRLVRHLAFLPWLRPIHWTAQFETEIEEPSEGDRVRAAKLKMEVYAGLAATFDDFQSYSPHPPGVEMWGNGRLFSLKGRIDDESVGWGYKFGGAAGKNPTATASSRRLTIVVLFTADDSRDIPWAAPVKNDYNRRSEFYAEIQYLLARVIRLFKNALSFHVGRLLPFSQAWTQYTDQQELDKLFEDSDATPAFKQEFARSRFGKKILAFRPEFSFQDMSGSDAESTPFRVYGITTGTISSTVSAAAATKDSGEQVIEFLKALFPQLARQAELEQDFGLALDEELHL